MRKRSGLFALRRGDSFFRHRGFGGFREQIAVGVGNQCRVFWTNLLCQSVSVTSTRGEVAEVWQEIGALDNLVTSSGLLAL